MPPSVENDPFARELAKNAIETALETREIVLKMQRASDRNRGIFKGLCALCGTPIRKGSYCHAHSWAG